VPFEQVRYEAGEGLATITLNRLERPNAVTGVMLAYPWWSAPPFEP
jgi:enoyl-CoA hydratase/carnithine racemase